MFTIVLQIIALVILAGGMWLAYQKLIIPLNVSLNIQQKGAIGLTLLALVGGFVGGWFWWVDEPRSFAWDLPPLASRMLAAAGWSFFVISLMVLQRPTFRRVRLVMLNLWVYLAPLAAVIVLFHLDRFDAFAPITYTFFGIAILMAGSSTWYLLRPPRRIVPDDHRDSLPSGRIVKSWLGMVALLTGIWGLALFLTDKGPSGLVWVWPGDLLSSRLIGVMLLTIAAGAIYSMRFADLSKVMLAMTIAYSAGLAAASFWNILTGKPIKPAYLIVFGIIFLGSMVSLFLDNTVRPEWSRKRPGDSLVNA